jgi:hypothetical protein
MAGQTELARAPALALRKRLSREFLPLFHSGNEDSKN